MMQVSRITAAAASGARSSRQLGPWRAVAGPHASYGIQRLCTATTGDAAAPAASTKVPISERKLRVYTRTGDKGSTSLYNGERRSKADPVFEALGHTDELNAQLGVAREHCQQLVDLAELCSQLTVIQSRLLDVGSAIATPIDTSSAAKLSRVTFADAHVVALEKWIDAMDDTLPALRNFILPSGGLAAAHLHVARTVCRRAERAVVPLVADGHVPPEVGRYLNRLSDFFFVAARFASAAANAKEVVYKKQDDATTA